MTFRFFAAALVLLLGGCAAQARTSFKGTPVAMSAPDFTLTSDTGKPWTLSAQRGKIVALFFGYTRCTDTCPDTLAKLSASLRKAGAKTPDAEIAFVTIDPQHDSAAQMHRYLQERFPGDPIVGLTGTTAQIAAVKDDYHVFADSKDDHSTFTILIDRSGEERVIHDADDSQAAFTSDFHVLLQS